jgi:hypothetical protein
LGRALGDDYRRQEGGAREFAQFVGTLVNATISQSRVTFTKVDGPTPTWFLAHVGADRLPAPLPLVNGHYLYLFQVLGLRREEKYLATLEYRYTYQRTADDDSWIFRYEYKREPPEPYPYALSHVHVNASPLSYGGAEPFPGLHLPTGKRITIELLIRHLIAEHGIEPLSPNWEAAVARGEKLYREIQKKRMLKPGDPRE